MYTTFTGFSVKLGKGSWWTFLVLVGKFAARSFPTRAYAKSAKSKRQVFLRGSSGNSARTACLTYRRSERIEPHGLRGLNNTPVSKIKRFFARL